MERRRPGRLDRYDALEFAHSKRYGDNWLLYASYVWSRLYGNYHGLSQSDENGRVSPNVGRLYDLVEMMFDETGRPVFGPLPTDRPHRLKAHGVYTLPFGTTVGATTYYVASGVPVTRELGFLPPNNFPIQYRGRMSDGRTDTMSQTDVYLQHEFRLPGREAAAGEPHCPEPLRPGRCNGQVVDVSARERDSVPKG